MAFLTENWSNKSLRNDLSIRENLLTRILIPLPHGAIQISKSYVPDLSWVIYSSKTFIPNRGYWFAKKTTTIIFKPREMRASCHSTSPIVQNISVLSQIHLYSPGKHTRQLNNNGRMGSITLVVKWTAEPHTSEVNPVLIYHCNHHIFCWVCTDDLA